jgi:hypothetical protein
MVYEHFLGCFIPNDPSLRFLELFQIVVVVHGDIPRSMTLVLGVNKLLAMTKDTRGFHPITIGEHFFDLLNISLSYSFRSHFRNIYPPLIWRIDR